jgi:hypothetical protein
VTVYCAMVVVFYPDNVSLFHDVVGCIILEIYLSIVQAYYSSWVSA